MTAQSKPSSALDYTHTEPSRKMDARGLTEGVCTCGYRTSPATFADAAKRVRLHFEAKHGYARPVGNAPSDHSALSSIGGGEAATDVGSSRGTVPDGTSSIAGRRHLPRSTSGDAPDPSGGT